MAEIYDGTDVDYDTAERADHSVPTGIVADCGHSFCYEWRVEKGERWCSMGHPLKVALTPEALTIIMTGLACAARESQAAGHTSTAINQWRMVLSLEIAAKLTDDADATQKLIDSLSS